jgi:hypothetical protein
MAVYYQATDVAQGTYRKLLRQDMLWGGLAGLLAGGALTVFFFGYDVLWFRPLATPDFLSGALLGGTEPGAETVESLRNVRIAIFTILHLVAFTLLGMIFARFFRFTQLRKTLMVGALWGLIVCTAVLAAGMQVTGTQMSAEPGWPGLLAGNVAAGVVMVLFLRRTQGVDPPR